jgi:hypothetical protein
MLRTGPSLVLLSPSARNTAPQLQAYDDASGAQCKRVIPQCKRVIPHLGSHSKGVAGANIKSILIKLIKLNRSRERII